MFSSGAAPQSSRSCRRATAGLSHVVVTCPPDACAGADASPKSRQHGGGASRTGCLLRLPSAGHHRMVQHPAASGDIGPVLTPRALAAGLLVGSVLCFSNTFFGLQTGWVTMGSLQSAILGYGLFQGLWAAGLLSRHLSVGENIIVQTTAVATATMPLAAGLVGIIPALGLLSPDQNPPSGPLVLSTLQLLGWCTALAFFGVFCAVPLRHQTIIREQLTFPSGTATASVIRTLHGLPAPVAAGEQGEQVGAAAARRSSAGAGGQPEAAAQQADLEAPRDGGTGTQQQQRQPGSSSADGHSGPSQPGLQVAVLEEAHTERSSLLGEASRGYNGSSDGAAGGVAAGSSWQLQQQRQQQWQRALHVLMWCFAASGAYSLAAAWVKPLKVWPIFDWVHLPAATAWGWVFQPSAGYIGQGAIMGPKTAFSMLGGAVTGWAILGPMAKAKGWAPGPITDAEAGAAGWLMWLGLALLLGDCFSELALLVGSTLLQKARQHGWLLLLPLPGEQGARRAQQQLSGPGAAWGGGPAAAAAQGRHSGSPRLRPRNGSVKGAPGASLLEMSSSTSSSSRSLDGAAAMAAAEDASIGTAAAGPASAPAKQAAVPPLSADADDTASDPWGWMLSVRCWGPGLLLSTAVAIAILAPMMGMPWYEPLVAVVFSLLVALLAVRALGQTDLNPVSGVGKISQLVFAMVSGKVLPNLVAGAIAEAAAQQAGDLMQDFKAAHLLGVPPSSQLVAMLLGSAASVPISVAAFKLYTTAWQVPGPELPAPTARVWLDMAALVNGGSLPAHVGQFCAGAGAIAALLPVLQLLLKRCQRREQPRPPRPVGSSSSSGGVLRQAGARLLDTWRARSGVDWALALLPSGVGFAVGMYLQPRWTLPRVLGSVAEQAWLLVSPGTHAAFMVVAASGLVLGEGCSSVVTAVVQAAMKGGA